MEHILDGYAADGTLLKAKTTKSFVNVDPDDDILLAIANILRSSKGRNIYICMRSFNGIYEHLFSAEMDEISLRQALLQRGIPLLQHVNISLSFIRRMLRHLVSVSEAYETSQGLYRAL